MIDEDELNRAIEQGRADAADPPAARHRALGPGRA